MKSLMRSLATMRSADHAMKVQRSIRDWHGRNSRYDSRTFCIMGKYYEYEDMRIPYDT